MSWLVYGIAATNGVVYVAQNSPETARVTARHTSLSLRQFSARPWTLLTHAFAHASLTHLGFNILNLVMFAPAIAASMGPSRFGLLYAGSAVCGGAAQLYHNSLSRARDLKSLGASGALSGLLLYHCTRVPHGETYIYVFPIRNSVLGAVFLGGNAVALASEGGGQVAYAEHLGGGLAGAAAALLVRSRILR
jgi:membrane associated rhomboid family serine protease